VYKLVEIKIISNVWDYRVELQSEKIHKTFSFECPEQECSLKEISPFDYNISVIKDGYLLHNSELIFEWREKVSLEVILEKEITLEKQELSEIVELTKIEKIEQIKKKRGSYAFFSFQDGREYSFLENNGVLDLYLGENKVGSFDIEKKKDILLQEVSWSSDYIYLQMGTNKSLYNIVNKSLYPISLKIPVVYVKEWWNNFEFLMVTDKGTFIYSIRDNSLNYFTFFQDFVYLEDSYIGIINSDEKKRLQNLWLEKETQNLVISYNPKTKERKILFRTFLDILKVVKEWENIILIDDDGGEYKLENF